MKEKFGQDLKMTLEELLEQRFNTRQEELLGSVSHTPETEFVEMAESIVNSFTENISGEVMGAKELIEDKLKVAKQELGERRARQRALQEELYAQERKDKQQGRRSLYIYVVIFTLLELGAVATFCYGVNFVLPGLPIYIAIVPSLVMLIPSLSIAWAYGRKPNKEEFARRLTAMAMYFGFATIIFFGAAMTLACQALEKDMSSGSFLSSNSSYGGSAIEFWQSKISIATIMLLLVSENLFAGLLKIEMSRAKEAEHSYEKLKDELLPRIETEIEELEDQC